jgi:hypothetical protein
MTVSGLTRNVSIKSGGYSLSEEALRALQAGDVNALMESHRGRWNLNMMADDDGDDDDDSDDDDDDTSGDAGKKGKKSGDSGSGDDGDDDDDGSGDDDDDTKAAIARMEKRMKAADKRASDAEARLRKIDDSKKDELTKATDRVAEVEEENTTLKDTVNGLRLEVAFLSINDQTWHKPGVALRLAQSEGYLEDVMDDDGKVDEKAMKKALANLAKDNEYLVKKAGTGEGGGSGSSGSPAGGRSGNGKDDKQAEEQDRRRAPALNRRR